MRKTLLTITLTAVLAFSLGYYLRGAIALNFTAPAEQRSAAEATAKKAVSDVANATSSVRSVESEHVRSAQTGRAEATTSSTLGSVENAPVEAAITANRDKQLAEFAQLMGLDLDWTRSIAEQLDALNSKQKERREATNIADVLNNPLATDAEKKDAKNRSDLLQELYMLDQRQILGEHYESYREFNRTYPHRKIMNAVDAALPEPIYRATRDDLLQILDEEDRPANVSLSNPQYGPIDNTDLVAYLQAQIEAQTANNLRILARSQPYLTPEQHQALATALNEEVERNQVTIRLLQLSKDR